MYKLKNTLHVIHVVQKQHLNEGQRLMIENNFKKSYNCI